MRLLGAILIASLLMACEKLTPAALEREVDQCLRNQIFERCLARVPPGPTVTGKYNDWDEIVDSCESAAYYQSLRRASAVPPECRVGE